MIPYTCIQCGASARGSSGNPRKFCSRACFYAYRAEWKLKTVGERFWSKVDKNGPTIRMELGPCWIWTGPRISKEKGDYGTFSYGSLWAGASKPLVTVLAHRFSLELHTGHAVPNEMFACHHCDNPPCVRPKHLFAGTNEDNVMDCVRKGRFPTKITDAQVIEVCQRYTGVRGEISKLAAEYGISRVTLGQILAGKGRPHILNLERPGGFVYPEVPLLCPQCGKEKRRDSGSMCFSCRSKNRRARIKSELNIPRIVASASRSHD